MAQLSRLSASFKACTGPYPWRDFAKLLGQLGYVELPKGQTGGSRRKYKNPETGHLIMLDKPHNNEMGPGMVRRLQRELEDRGIL